MKFSLIIPCHNESGNIHALYGRIRECLDGKVGDYELIFVDDGSTDDTFAKLAEIEAKTEAEGSAASTLTKEAEGSEASPAPNVVVIEFSRNFGKESAMLAGMDQASGDYVGIVDADLQQDPATSLEMLQFLETHPEYDSVVAVQKERQEGRVLKWFKRHFYKAFNAVGDIEIPANASDFRVFRKYVADALCSMPEYYRFSKGLFAWVGFNTYCMEYMPAKRASGESSWSFGKLMSYALSGIVSFSTWPLRLVLYLGLITSFAAIIYLIVIIGEYFIVGIEVPGYPTLACLVLLFSGVVMLCLGIFGEYIGRIYIEGKQRPAYIARSIKSSDGRLSGESSVRTVLKNSDKSSNLKVDSK